MRHRIYLLGVRIYAACLLWPHFVTHKLDCCADFLTSDNVIASKRETMWETIQHIEEKYGGAAAYAKAAGLSDEEIAQIRSNLLLREDTTDLLHTQPAH